MLISMRYMCVQFKSLKMAALFLISRKMSIKELKHTKFSMTKAIFLRIAFSSRDRTIRLYGIVSEIYFFLVSRPVSRIEKKTSGNDNGNQKDTSLLGKFAVRVYRGKTVFDRHFATSKRS